MAFQIIRSDITKIKADAIVNSANPNPVVGRGVDYAIYEAAGFSELIREREKIGVMQTGEVAETQAFHLNAKYIIHTVGPVWSGGNSGELLALEACYRNCLELAARLKCKSIAFPMISTGVYGFPKDEALRIALRTIGTFLETADMEIMLVVYDERSFELSSSLREQIREWLSGVTDSNPESSPKSPLVNRLKRPRLQESEIRKENSQVFESAEQVSGFTGELPDLDAIIGDSLADRVAHIGDTFQQCLLRLIDQRGLTDVYVYKKANIDRKLFSKIRCNVNYVPKKQTVIALAIALELSLDETVDLLRRAGMALSPVNVFDLIVEYCIEHQMYDIFEVNALLFEYKQPLLGC